MEMEFATVGNMEAKPLLEGVKNIELVTFLPDLYESTQRVGANLVQYPYEVHTQIFVGVSGAGKTTAAVQAAQVYEGRKLRRDIRESTGNPNRSTTCFHLSLGSGLRWGKESGEIVVPPDKDPLDLTDDQFQIGAENVVRGVNLLREVFTNDPDHSVIIAVDTVALTRFNTGSELLRLTAGDNNTLVTAMLPHPEIESLAIMIRDYLAQNPGNANINEVLGNLRVNFGVDMVNMAMQYVRSSANEFGRLNALRDYYEQLKDKTASGKVKYAPEYEELTFDEFVNNVPVRFGFYQEFYPVRLEELGVRSERLVTVQNEPIPASHAKEVHSHFDRLLTHKNVDLSILRNTPRKNKLREQLLTP